MRIAQVAPLWEPISPQGHNGIEILLGTLTDELVRRGHEVTLFAAEGSETLARLQAIAPPLVQQPWQNPALYEALQHSRIRDLADQFDLIHFHTWVPPFHLTDLLSTPTVYTLYGNFSDESRLLYSNYGSHNFISVSDAQRKPGPNLNYIRTIHAGVYLPDYPFYEPIELAIAAEDEELEPTPPPPAQPYLAFIGRISPQKGPHHAIEIAQQTGIPLKLAGRINAVDQGYFDREIAPHLDGQFIQYWGEIDHDQKIRLLGDALATVLPVTWEEPCGLGMIESMALGTPVIAMNQGVAPEIVVNGKTGFICDSIDEMVVSTSKVGDLSRRDCRELVTRYFSVQQMVDKYEAAYGKVLEERISRNGHVHVPTLTR